MNCRSQSVRMILSRCSRGLTESRTGSMRCWMQRQRSLGVDELISVSCSSGEGRFKADLEQRTAAERLPVDFLDPMPKEQLAGLLIGSMSG